MQLESETEFNKLKYHKTTINCLNYNLNSLNNSLLLHFYSNNSLLHCDFDLTTIQQ